MKRIFLLAMAFSSCSVFAQWGGGGFGGGGFGGFGGEGSTNNGNIGDYKSEQNIDYVGDGHVGHKLDIRFPNNSDAKHPVLIHIYGSAWGSNDSKGSADLGTVGTAALSAGYILVNPNHRTYNDAQYPAQIQDIKAVVRFLRGNAEKYGIDTSFIAVSGFSSGGHLASLMGTTRHIKGDYTVGSATMDMEGKLGNYTSESSWVDAVVDWSGPVDCRYKGCGNPIQMAPENDMVGGCDMNACPDKHALLGANTFITAGSAPTMVCHGSGDNIVPQCEGKMFYDNLEQAGVDCEYYPHSGGHGVAGEYTDEMITFLNRIREKKAASVPVTDPTYVATIKSETPSICLDGEKIYLCNSEAESCHITLSDLSGKVLMQGEMNADGINISALNQGIYFVRTDNGNTFKFIK